MSSKEKRFFWKGKRVSEKVYSIRVQKFEQSRKIRGDHGQFISPNFKSNVNIAKTAGTRNETASIDISSAEGRRIVHIKTLGEQMFCREYKSILSLTNITEEKQIGLVSMFFIKCSACEKITRVSTDKQHKVSGQNFHYDSNTKIAFGTLNGGLGNTHVNKLLAALNIPEMNWHTYQTHEKEVGKMIEALAHECCLAAAVEERCLTIENTEKIKGLLPPHLDLSFIFPNSSVTNIKNKNINDTMTVRIAASFDMGWFTRGTGRTYDSLSGTAALIGYFSKKVIGYVILNRKCAKCDLGHKKDDHDCRLNFTGSAKAMEPQSSSIID